MHDNVSTPPSHADREGQTIPLSAAQRVDLLRRAHRTDFEAAASLLSGFNPNDPAPVSWGGLLATAAKRFPTWSAPRQAALADVAWRLATGELVLPDPDKSPHAPRPRPERRGRRKKQAGPRQADPAADTPPLRDLAIASGALGQLSLFGSGAG